MIPFLATISVWMTFASFKVTSLLLIRPDNQEQNEVVLPAR